VTWRLADALPQEKLNRWKWEKTIWLEKHPEPWDAKTEEAYRNRFTRPIEEWLDQGTGSCLLRKPDYAHILAETLLHFVEVRYLLRNFVIMPNHVHVLLAPQPGFELGGIVQSWKGFSAKKINELRKENGKLWQADYWDRLIRNEKHFQKAVKYIQENPTKAGLKDGEYVYWEGGLSSPP
jgi:REP element-mobilizing transposase RayT